MLVCPAAFANQLILYHMEDDGSLTKLDLFAALGTNQTDLFRASRLFDEIIAKMIDKETVMKCEQFCRAEHEDRDEYARGRALILAEARKSIIQGLKDRNDGSFSRYEAARDQFIRHRIAIQLPRC